MEAHDTQEQIERAHHQSNKRAAILIVGLAAALAIAEMAGKGAQSAAIAHNIESSDLWAFYQAKTIRSTVVHTAVETTNLLSGDALSAERAAARQKQIDAWRSAADRYDSDPTTGEGRKELAERAKQVGELRDQATHAYHDYEYGSAALQLAIVMASAAVITEVALLELVSACLGAAGIALGVIGWLSPALLRL